MSKMSFVICHVLEVVCRVREKRQAALLEGKQVGRLRAYPPPLLPLLSVRAHPPPIRSNNSSDLASLSLTQ